MSVRTSDRPSTVKKESPRQPERNVGSSNATEAQSSDRYGLGATGATKGAPPPSVAATKGCEKALAPLAL
eukprot:scaffold55551_cov29-Tisochrysis_lutea.AAC.2